MRAAALIVLLFVAIANIARAAPNFLDTSLNCQPPMMVNGEPFGFCDGNLLSIEWTIRPAPTDFASRYREIFDLVRFNPSPLLADLLHEYGVLPLAPWQQLPEVVDFRGRRIGFCTYGQITPERAKPESSVYDPNWAASFFPWLLPRYDPMTDTRPFFFGTGPELDPGYLGAAFRCVIEDTATGTLLTVDFYPSNEIGDFELLKALILVILPPLTRADLDRLAAEPEQNGFLYPPVQSTTP